MLGRISFFLGALVVACASVACGGPKSGTDIGNGATIRFDLTKAPPPDPSAASSGSGKGGKTVGPAHIDQAWVVVEHVRVHEDKGCSPTELGEEAFEGPIVRDLTKVSTDPNRLDLKAGAYCGLRLDIRPLDIGALPSNAPAGLEGQAVFITGTRADGTPFSFSSKRPIGIKLKALDGAFDLSDMDDLLLAFAVDETVAALDLDSLEGSPIVISDASNSNRISPAEKVLRENSRLFADENHDGMLTLDETSDDHALAVPSDDGN